MTTREEAATRAAYWAGQADILDTEACRVMEAAPDAHPGAVSYAAHPGAVSYAAQRAAVSYAAQRAASLQARRDDAIRLAEMWTGVAAQLPAGTLPGSPGRMTPAEVTLTTVRSEYRRLRGYLAGFSEVLEDIDRRPWANTCGSAMAALDTALGIPAPAPADVPAEVQP